MQTLSKQIGQVIESHDRSVPDPPDNEHGFGLGGVGFDPRLAVALVTLIVSVKANRPVVESTMDGK